MQENLLHFIWKFLKFSQSDLSTTAGERLHILGPGDHNLYSGPDFTNARIVVGEQLWAGNVEIHLKASDWYHHGHDSDRNYENVILHVVWEENVPVRRTDGSPIATLELKSRIEPALLKRYALLFNARHQRFINCEADIAQIDSLLVSNWLQRLFIEKLESRSKELGQLLREVKNDWEQLLFLLLLRNFGLNINGPAFFAMGRRIPFQVVRKLAPRPLQLESLLLGMSGLLHAASVSDPYLENLRGEFNYQKRKFRLSQSGIPLPEFLRLRPMNFPTIRLSQFASLYSSQPRLFSRLMEAGEIGEIYSLFQVSASAYWETHYTFGKTSTARVKALSGKFVELLVLNTILPLKFCYLKYTGRPAEDLIRKFAESVKPEHNQIIQGFGDLGLRAVNGVESQGLLHLFKQYCSQNNCLHCAIGAKLLLGK